MIGQDLQSRADDEKQEHKVEVVLKAEPPGEARTHRWPKGTGAGIVGDELMDAGQRSQIAGNQDSNDQSDHYPANR